MYQHAVIAYAARRPRIVNACGKANHAHGMLERQAAAVQLEVVNLESTPLKRTGTPQEVANVAVFLASDESPYVIGDRIVCAAGRYM